MNRVEILKRKINYTSSMIRENRIEHHVLKKELKKLLKEFETPDVITNES